LVPLAGYAPLWVKYLQNTWASPGLQGHAQVFFAARGARRRINRAGTIIPWARQMVWQALHVVRFLLNTHANMLNFCDSVDLREKADKIEDMLFK
jgi:hypothetical protein